MKITIPKLSTSNAITFCKELNDFPQDETYYFDVSNVNNYEPLPMLLTAAAIRQFYNERSLESQQIQLRFINDQNFSYACHMGFFQAAGFPEGKAPGEASGSSSYIPLTKINISELHKKAIEAGNFIEQGDVIELEAKRLAIVLAQGKKEFQNLLQYLLREAIRNIPEHAETNDVWLCGQYWHNRDLAEIAILDEGIGIYNSLSKNDIHRDYILTNADSLRLAVEPGISVAFNPAIGQKSDDIWANSGYGLYMISEICKLTGGWLTLVSGENCLRIYDNNSSMNSTFYKGTALGIRVKPSKIKACQKLIEQARLNGEEKAKDIKNTYKEASTPSKGLLH